MTHSHTAAARLAEEALEDDAKATPGPWWLRDPSNSWSGIVSEAMNICGMHDGGRTGHAQADAQLICRMRTREPALARAVLELSEEVERLREYEELAREAEGVIGGMAAQLENEFGPPGDDPPERSWERRFDSLAARGGEGDNRAEVEE